MYNYHPCSFLNYCSPFWMIWSSCLIYAVGTVACFSRTSDIKNICTVHCTVEYRKKGKEDESLPVLVPAESPPEPMGLFFWQYLFNGIKDYGQGGRRLPYSIYISYAYFFVSWVNLVFLSLFNLFQLYIHISLFLRAMSFCFPYFIYISYAYFFISWVNLFFVLIWTMSVMHISLFLWSISFFLSLFHLYQFGIFLYFCDQSRFSFPIQSILVI